MGQNAIEWGNRQRVEDLVDITYRVFDDRVEIVIRDQGPGFDPRRCRTRRPARTRWPTWTSASSSASARGASAC